MSRVQKWYEDPLVRASISLSFRNLSRECPFYLLLKVGEEGLSNLTRYLILTCRGGTVPKQETDVSSILAWKNDLYYVMSYELQT